jgi:hypothetical protein
MVRAVVFSNPVFVNYKLAFQKYYRNEIFLYHKYRKIAEEVKLVKFTEKVEDLAFELEPWTKSRIIVFAAYCAHSEHRLCTISQSSWLFYLHSFLHYSLVIFHRLLNYVRVMNRFRNCF